MREGKLVPSRRTVWDVLREQVYLDAVVYSELGLKAAIDATGPDRLMFGTDHPFFPPLVATSTVEQEAMDGGNHQWESATLNVAAVHRALGEGTLETAAVMGGNAIRVLQLDEQDDMEKSKTLK